ncbi:MAG: HRDC domain-containing protein [Chloroflexi bacterium]|nr:HRDC domain-containing protein [Chloroflexota bacterium]
MESSDIIALKPPIWVNRPKELQRIIANLASYPTLAVDTESNSLHAYQEQVCLIQFSTPDEDYLIDPLAIDDLSALGPIFANPSIEKVFHAAEYDLICLKRDFGFKFTNLFDTMAAGRILGKSAVGLGAMLEEAFGLQLDKRYQRANWGQRPLPQALLAYARLDTHYLIALRDRLYRELIDQERWPIAEEDFRRMTSVNGHSSENGNRDNLWRISGAQDLEPRQAAVLYELVAFRDRQARLANVPAFKILGNEALLAIAQACPLHQESLDKLREITPRQAERYGSGLLRAVAVGMTAEPPQRPPGRPRDDKFVLRLEKLRLWRKHKAQGMGVESDVILPRDLLHILAERRPTCQEDLAEILETTPWRLEHFGEEILKILA